MKSLVLALSLLSAPLFADSIPYMQSLTQTSFVAQSYTASNGSADISLSNTASASGVPLTCLFWVTGPGAAALYGFDYVSYTSATTNFGGYLALSTTVMIDKLDPNMWLHVLSTGTGAVNGKLTIFGERK